MNSTASVPAPARKPNLARQLLTVAWLSLLLGLGLEVLLLALAAGTGTFKSLAPFVADFAQKVTWSTLVCIGLACGTLASRARAQVMGWMGLISAPIAFVAAKSVHKGAQQALSLSAAASAGPSPYLLAGLKALEYGVLGWLLGRLARRAAPTLAGHLRLGALVGALFGGTILWLLIEQAVPALAGPAIAARAVNELIFPIGCSVVLYVADVLGKKL